MIRMMVQQKPRVSDSFVSYSSETIAVYTNIPPAGNASATLAHRGHAAGRHTTAVLVPGSWVPYGRVTAVPGTVLVLITGSRNASIILASGMLAPF